MRTVLEGQPDLSEASGSDWVQRVTELSDRLTEVLDNGPMLRELGELIALVAERFGASYLSGASRTGQRLAEEVIADPSHHLAFLPERGGHGTVLVVEGLMATGTQVLRAAGTARQAGAERTAVVAVLADPVAAAFVREQLSDEVVVLETL